MVLHTVPMAHGPYELVWHMALTGKSACTATQGLRGPARAALRLALREAVHGKGLRAVLLWGLP